MKNQIFPRNKLLSWLTLLRLGATARGVLPFLLGAVIAWSQGYTIDRAILLLSSLAVICIMLVTFLVNEYYDYDTDAANKNHHRLSGGSRILPMGLIPRRHALTAAYILTGIAAGIGLWLYFGFKTGPLTIPLGIVAVIIGYTYTAGPVRLSYRGWGEISIWFACGWLATLTGYYLQTGQFNMTATLASLPGAFSVFLVILINEIPDIASDKISGKRNLAVRLGVNKTVKLYLAVLAVSYASIIAIAFSGAPVNSAYLSLLLLPVMIWITGTIRKHGAAERKVQEALSIRTMIYDHLITVIYTVSFILEGLNAGAPSVSQLMVLMAAFLVVFGLEGVGLVSSRVVLMEKARS